MRRSEATRPSTASRLSVSRGSSRGIKESVNAGRLSTSGAPLRSNRTPRGAAIGRIRIRFRSEASRKRPPSSTWRYQSCPMMTTNATVTATAIARMRCCTASRRPGMRRRPKTRLTRGGSGRAGAQGLDACEGHHERGAQEAVVERLREDDVEHHVAEGRREVKDLQPREPGEAPGYREYYEPGHLDERLGHREPAPRGPHREADDGLRERLHPDQSAPRRVLEEPRGEARHAPELGALTERQEHDDDEGKVGGHAVDAERRGERRVGDAPAEHGEREQRTHQPPVGKCAARSCRVSPVTRSTSSTRAKSTAGSSAA